MYEKVFDQFDIDRSRVNEWGLFSDRNKSIHIPNSKNTRLGQVVAHGDMIYLLPSSSQSLTNPNAIDMSKFEEDEVDIELAKQDGRIHRKRDEQL
jgi:hypothetical protein